jgi:Holliday junction resolvasome RuvABC endonuclease subunit
MDKCKYVTSLDLSLNECGYAVFERKSRGNPGLIDWGTIQNNHFSTTEEGRKLQRIEMVLMTLRASYHPTDIVCEEWLSNVNKSGSVNKQNGYKSAYKLGGVHGVAKKIYNDSEFIMINNMTMKKQFEGRGNCEKIDIINKCYEIKEKLVGKKNAKLFTVKNDNDADAIGLGVVHLMDIGEWK